MNRQIDEFPFSASIRKVRKIVWVLRIPIPDFTFLEGFQ